MYYNNINEVDCLCLFAVVVVVYHFITLIVDERREQTIVNQVELIVLKSFLISGCVRTFGCWGKINCN